MSDPAVVALPPTPRQAADQLIASFEEVARLARPLSEVCARVSRAIGPPADASDEAVHRASLAVARSIDHRHDFFDRHAYHNRQHFCEVILSAQLLCRLDRLPSRDARRVLLAALVHDLEHDGLPGTAFQFERRSVTRCAPFLARAGVNQAEYQALAALVLATDAREGVAAATRIRRWHDSGAPVGRIDAPVAELRALIDSPSLSRAAVLLCEADVLPSVGLTLTHALQLQDRLAREWNRSLTLDDKRRFIDDVLGAGVIGEFFRPNVLAIRESLQAPAHAA